jgi:hypothetical protein
VFLALISFVALRAYAADTCRELNLVSDPKSAVRYAMPDDQGDSRLCYAYATAFLANTYLMETHQYSSPLIHPVEAALISRTTIRDQFYEMSTLAGGDVAHNLTALRARGQVCGRSQTEMALKRLVAAGNFPSSIDAINFLETNQQGRLWARIGKKKFCSKNPEAQQWLEIQRLADTTQTEAVRQMLRGCEQRMVRFPRVASTNKYSDNDFAKAIEINLARHRPAGLDTSCSFKFFTQGWRGTGVTLKKTATGVQRETTEQCALERHATAIIGQKNFGGECHYLIRNSIKPNVRDRRAAACSCYDLKTNQVNDNCKTPTKDQRFVGCYYKRSDVLKIAVDAMAFQ